MTTKNPFEIRTELLQLSKDILVRQYETNVQNWTAMVDFATATTKATTQAGLEIADDFAKLANEKPTFPTIEQILEQAKTMYAFVGGKNA